MKQNRSEQMFKPKPQSITSPNLNDKAKSRGLYPLGNKRAKMGRKGAIPFLILIILLGLGGLLVFGIIFPNVFAKAVSTNEVNEIIDKAIVPQDNSVPIVDLREKIVEDEKDVLVLAPSELTPPPATNIVCSAPTGFFKELWVRHDNGVTANLLNQYKNKAEIVGIFRYTGNCEANVYIEAGVPNAPKQIPTLAFIPPIRKNVGALGTASICDGNKHFNGVSVKLQPQQEVVFLLKPENYGVEARYPVNIGAYTGCLKDGGKPIQEMVSEVEFSDKFSAFQIDNSWFGG